MTNRFELLEQLGKGGMGTVWKARDAETGEFVALKLLHEMYVDDADYVARFEREVDIARKIASPHVVKVFGYGRRDGVPYVAMEYVEGPSLRERIREGGPMGWADTKRLATQMSQALSAAHAAGVIHRDVKPSNVLLDPSGNVKLADFGIARAADLTRMTGSVTVLGTPAYMSPDGEANEQSDLYGLGCVLFEMLTGSPPFVGESQQQVILKHIRETPDLEKLPAEARPVLGWLLEKDPKDRPGSADALVAVLEGSTKGPLPKPVTLTGGRGHRRKTAVLVGALGLPLLLLTGAGIFLASTDGSRDNADHHATRTAMVFVTTADAAETATGTPSLTAAATATQGTTAHPPPIIAGFEWSPREATSGQVITVSFRIDSVGGSTVVVRTEQVSGTLSLFGTSGFDEQTVTNSQGEYRRTFGCDSTPYEVSLMFTVRDRNGESSPATASLVCLGSPVPPADTPTPSVQPRATIPPTQVPVDLGRPDFLPVGASLTNDRSTLAVTVANIGSADFTGSLVVGSGGFGIPPPHIPFSVVLPAGATTTVYLPLGIAVHESAIAAVAVDPNNAIEEDNESNNEADFPLGPPPSPPAPPSGVIAEIVSFDLATCLLTVDVWWTDNSTNESGFVIGPISTPDAYPGWLGFATLPPNSTYGRYSYRYNSGGIFPAFVFAIIDYGSTRIFSPVVGGSSGQFVTVEGGSHCAT